jgi:hypothetical protein
MIEQDKIAFTIGNTEYQLKPVTISVYYRLQEILKSQSEANSKFAVVSALTQCPVSELRRLKNMDWLVIWAETNSLIETLAGLDTTAIQPTMEFNSIPYGLPRPETMTIGEFADLEILFTADDFQKRLHEAAAILYRPLVNSDGDIEEYDADAASKRAKAFLDLPISALRSANAFFLQYANHSLSSTLQFLTEMEEVKEILSQDDLEHLKSLRQQEFIGQSSINWLGKTLSDLQRQQQLNFIQHSTGYRGKSQKTKRGKSFWRKVKDEAGKIKAKRNKK